MIIEQHYQTWLRAVFSGPVPPEQEKAMRAAFYAGAAHGCLADQQEAIANITEVQEYIKTLAEDGATHEQN